MMATATHLKRAFCSLFSAGVLLCAQHVAAELQAIDDEGLEQVSGQLGMIVDDFKLFGHPDSNIQLTFDTNLDEDSIYLDHIAIYGSDSSTHCNANPSFIGCSGFSIGTASDPIELDVATESGITYIDLSMPENTSSETGIDADFRLLTNTYKSTGKLDINWIQLRNLKLAGSSLRIWGSDIVAGANSGQPVGMSMAAVVNAKFDLSVDASNSRGVAYEYEKLPPYSTNDKPRGENAGILRLVGAELDLRLGLFPHIPVVIGSVNRDPGEPGYDPTLCTSAVCKPDFFVEIPAVSNATMANALYGTPKSSLTIDQVFVGADNAGNPALIGSMEVTGIRIQHLRFETRG